MSPTGVARSVALGTLYFHSSARQPGPLIGQNSSAAARPPDRLRGFAGAVILGSARGLRRARAGWLRGSEWLRFNELGPTRCDDGANSLDWRGCSFLQALSPCRQADCRPRIGLAFGAKMVPERARNKASP